MRSYEETLEKRDLDLQFVISAVTTDLATTAYHEYFSAWEHNGGDQWFFDECVEITKKFMLEDPMYKNYLEAWRKSESIYLSFNDYSNECLDWHYMSKARTEFESRYKKDSDEEILKQRTEQLIHILGKFKTKKERESLVSNALSIANKEALKRENNGYTDKIKEGLIAIDTDEKEIERILSALSKL
tara:strand:+ start:384 stop:944 length:561 start_codon:yes stop_codon:yes gene_type:complete